MEPTKLHRRSFLAASTAAFFTPQLLHGAENKARQFKLGLVTYNVAASWDLPTILKTCKDVGIAAVECRTTHKHGVEPSLGTAARKMVKQQFADAGIVFWGSGSTCEFHSDDSATVKKNIEQCKEFISLVKDLGGTGVKVRPNGVAKGSTPEKACDQIGKALQECGKAAADAGVEIWLEVHGAVTQLPRNMKAIMESCGHKAVGITWNSNATDLIDGKIDEAFKMLAPWIMSCHINDLGNDKTGKYPYRELFKKLRTMNYDRYTLCEVGKTYEPEAGLSFLKEYAKTWEELSR